MKRLRRKEEEDPVIKMLEEKNKNSFDGEKLLSRLTSSIAKVKGEIIWKKSL